MVPMGRFGKGALGRIAGWSGKGSKAASAEASAGARGRPMTRNTVTKGSSKEGGVRRGTGRE